MITGTPSTTSKKLLRFLKYLVVAYLVIILLLMIFEATLIFPAPSVHDGDWLPRHLEFDEVKFSAEDGTRLHGWYFPHRDPRGYLLYCHGNGTFVPHLADLADMLRQRYQYSVFIWDYRGYGKSEGRPNEAGVLLDARAAYDWLKGQAKHPSRGIVLMGRSLGGAVVVDLAANREAKAIVLMNTFTSIVDVAAHHYPWLPIRWCMRTRFDSVSKIGNVVVPIMQTHGTKDSIVPFEFGKKLFDAASAPEKEFVAVTGAGHNDPPSEEVYRELDRFLRRLDEND